MSKRVDIPALKAVAKARKRGAVVDVRFAKYANDPVLFTREVLGLELSRHQVLLLRAIAGHLRVAGRSGHKIGKSTIAAIALLWFVCTQPGARVILVAPTAKQTREITWREVRLLHRNAKIPIGGELNETPDAGLRFPDGREAFGIATDQPERFAGISGANLLFIVDEASGVPETIFEALRGNSAGGARVLMLGNPTRTSGYFYDAFHRRAEFWHRLHISSLDSPNITGEASIPGLATREWADEMREEYGETSPIYQVRVLGEFPTQAADSIISLGLVEAARARWAALADTDILAPLELGVDVARFGDDDSVIIARRGPFAFPAVVVHGLDSIQVAARVAEEARRLARANERPVVKVDVIGVGAGVVDQLRLHRDLEVVEVNVSESASVDQYTRLRDQLWFSLRDWLKTGAIPSDPKLEAELVAPVYAFDIRGRIKVESKDDMRARLKRSPDRADALALACYVAQVGVTVSPIHLERGPFARRMPPIGPCDAFGRRLAR